MDKLMQIEGLNTKKGLSFSADSIDVYKKSIKLFVQAAEEKSKKIIEGLADEDWDIIGKEAHAIKGGLLVLGEEILSQEASVLEQAGKNADTKYCIENTEAFCEKLKLFLLQLKTCIISKTEKKNLKTGNPEVLYMSIALIIEALEEFDSDRAEEVLSKLANFTFGDKIDEILYKVTNLLEGFDFGQSIEEVKTIK